MQTKNIQTKSFLFVLAIAVVFLANQIHATTFVSNTNPPTNNAETPIYTLNDQIKGDGLPCTGTGTTCGLAVNIFTAEQNASFNKQTFFSNMITGLSTGATTSTLKFGGFDPSGTERKVDVNVAGSFSATGVLASSTIMNSSGSGELCADQNGDIVLCINNTTGTIGLEVSWGGGGSVELYVVNTGQTYNVTAADVNGGMSVPFGSYTVQSFNYTCPTPLIATVNPSVGTTHVLDSSNPNLLISISCM